MCPAQTSLVGITIGIYIYSRYRHTINYYPITVCRSRSKHRVAKKPFFFSIAGTCLRFICIKTLMGT